MRILLYVVAGCLLLASIFLVVGTPHLDPRWFCVPQVGVAVYLVVLAESSGRKGRRGVGVPLGLVFAYVLGAALLAAGTVFTATGVYLLLLDRVFHPGFLGGFFSGLIATHLAIGVPLACAGVGVLVAARQTSAKRTDPESR